MFVGSELESKVILLLYKPHPLFFLKKLNNLKLIAFFIRNRLFLFIYINFLFIDAGMFRAESIDRGEKSLDDNK